jgi:tail assembly chaperone
MEKEITINSNEYRIAQYRLEKRMIFHGQLARLAGYGAKVADGIVNGLVDENIQLDQIGIGETIKGIMDKIEPEKNMRFILDTIRALVKSPKQCSIDGKDSAFEQYFTDKFEDVYPLFIEIVEYNVQDSVSGELKKKLASYLTTMLGSIGEPEVQASGPDSQT